MTIERSIRNVQEIVGNYVNEVIPVTEKNTQVKTATETEVAINARTNMMTIKSIAGMKDVTRIHTAIS